MSPTTLFDCAVLLPSIVLALVVLAAVMSALLAPVATWCAAFARAAFAWGGAVSRRARRIALRPRRAAVPTVSTPAPGAAVR